jgi:hypothetical protein
MLLPISINYDRVPEEQALMKELAGGPKPLMRMGPLLRWCRELIDGQVQIGRVHMVCGQPVAMSADSDVHAVSQAVMAQLQENYVVSSYQLRAFLLHHPELELTLQDLSEVLRQRGATVIESPIEAVSGVDARTEQSLRYQWLHFFYPDLLARCPQHPIAVQHVRSQCFSARYAQAAQTAGDARLDALLPALFRPLEQAYARLIEVAEREQGLPDAHPKAFVTRHPDCFLPMVEEALEHLAAAGLLVKSGQGHKPPLAGKGFVLGEAWQAQIAAWRAPLWAAPAASSAEAPLSRPAGDAALEVGSLR